MVEGPPGSSQPVPASRKQNQLRATSNELRKYPPHTHSSPAPTPSKARPDVPRPWLCLLWPWLEILALPHPQEREEGWR